MTRFNPMLVTISILTGSVAFSQWAVGAERQRVPSSLWKAPQHHVDVSRNDAIWEGYPDVTLTGTGKLIVLYKEGDGHGIIDCRWSKLCVIESTDMGKTWKNRQVIMDAGWVEMTDDGGQTWRPKRIGRESGTARGLTVNCPKISTLADGSILIIANMDKWEDTTRYGNMRFWKSTDDGRTWRRVDDEPMQNVNVSSRVVDLGDGRLVFADAKTMRIFQSIDGGKIWKQIGRAAVADWTRLAEVGMCLLPDGRLAAVIGDRKYSGWPAHLTFSHNGGKTWTPLRQIGIPAHSPCIIPLEDGRVCITYRVGSGSPGSKAWVGYLDDLPRFAVHADRWFDNHTRINEQGLHIDNDGAIHQYSQYHLYPPETNESDLTVEVEVKVLSNEGRAAGLCLGSVGWVQFFPDHIRMQHNPELRLDVEPGFHTYRFHRVEGSRLEVSVDGAHKTTWSDFDTRFSRFPWLSFGNHIDADRLGDLNEAYKRVFRPEFGYGLRRILPHHVSPANTGHSIWRCVRVQWSSPNMSTYSYQWRPARDGFPDQWDMENTLELSRAIQNPHTSMSGCVQLPDGRLFAVYYFADGAPISCPSLNSIQPDRGHSCYVRGTFYSLEDFGRGFVTESGSSPSWPAAEVARPGRVEQAAYEPG